MTWAGLVLAALGLFLTAEASATAEKALVTWHPSKPRIGDVAWVLVKDVADTATVEGSVDGKLLTFFPYAGGHAALFGIDLDMKPGTHAWRVGVVEPGREPRSAQGSVKIARRDFHVERLTLPNTMVELDPETERRAVAEGKQLAALYRTITPERFWRGKFTIPVGMVGTGTGFGARRVIMARLGHRTPAATTRRRVSVQPDGCPTVRRTPSSNARPAERRSFDTTRPPVGGRC